MSINFASITGSIRRRMNSDSSSIGAPSSPNTENRRPTLETIIPQSAQRLDTGPLMFFDTDLMPPASSHSEAPASAFYPAREHQDALEEETEYPPFNTMAGLCDQMGLLYPLERQTARHIESVSGYTGPALSTLDYATTITELRERPLRKVIRRASIVGRHAKRFSGTLSRRASKLLGLSTAQDVIRSGERTVVDDDGEWDLDRKVDLGREVSTGDWRRSVESSFREVDWTAFRSS